jgi:hypothetical protein
MGRLTDSFQYLLPCAVRYAQSSSTADSSFEFLRALFIYPEDGVWGNAAPPYASSKHAFISSTTKPVIVRLRTQVTPAACYRNGSGRM